MSTAGFSTGPASSQPVNLCRVCQQTYRLSERFCPHCRIRLLITGQTGKISQNDAGRKHDQPIKVQALSNADHIQVVLEIQRMLLILPTMETMVIGRMTNRDNPTDIDLSGFNAVDLGVSRQHIRLTRDSLIYIEDLNTTNGTFVNGMKLVPSAQYMLTNGDELRLGQLSALVVFHRPD